jgi:hypothetical protein
MKSNSSNGSAQSWRAHSQLWMTRDDGQKDMSNNIYKPKVPYLYFKKPICPQCYQQEKTINDPNSDRKAVRRGLTVKKPAHHG